MAANFVLLKRSQFPLILCPSNDCRKVAEHGQRATIHHLERRGKPRESRFFLWRISAGIGTRLGQGFVGFQALDRPGIRDILRSLYALPVRARRQGVLSLILAQQDRGTGSNFGTS